MNSEREIQNNITTEHVEKGDIKDTQPKPVETFSKEDFNKFRIEYENLKYEFLKLRNEIKSGNPEKGKEEKDNQDNELEKWII